MYEPSISLFMMMPVSGTTSLLPKRRLIVVMAEIARPEWSTVATWDVPGLHYCKMRVLRKKESGETYVSKLSNPAGSYADTFCVRKSEIFLRISSTVCFFSMSFSYSDTPSTNSGSPRTVLYNASQPKPNSVQRQ